MAAPPREANVSRLAGLRRAAALMAQSQIIVVLVDGFIKVASMSKGRILLFHQAPLGC